MKNPLEQINWLIIILACITTLGLSIVYALIFSTNFLAGIIDLLSNIIPNIVAILITFIVIYFLFTSKGIYFQKEFKQDIVNGLIKAQKDHFGFRENREINDEFNLKQELNETKELNIIAFSAYNLVTELRPQITQTIVKGCRVRIIVIKANSPASKLLMSNQERREIEPDLQRLKGRIKQIIDSISQSKVKGKIEVKEINWLPSCSLIITNPTKNNGKIRLKVYPISIDIPLPSIKTHMIIHKETRPELFSYFISQFEFHWERAENIKGI